MLNALKLVSVVISYRIGSVGLWECLVQGSKGEVSKASRGRHWEVFLPFQPTRESASRFDRPKSTVYFGYILLSVSLNRWKRNLPVLCGV